MKVHIRLIDLLGQMVSVSLLVLLHLILKSFRLLFAAAGFSLDVTDDAVHLSVPVYQHTARSSISEYQVL